MGRGISYRTGTTASSQTSGSPAYSGRAGNAPPQVDSYSERIVKYVPAEILAFFIPATAAWGDDHNKLLVICAIAFIGTPFYRWVADRQSGNTGAPLKRWIGYGLAAVAFVAWAIGTSPSVSDWLGLSLESGGFALMLAAFLIPAADIAVDLLAEDK